MHCDLDGECTAILRLGQPNQTQGAPMNCHTAVASSDLTPLVSQKLFL